jgi:hypothetical protein
MALPFSQRNNHVPVRTMTQLTDFDTPTRNAMWSVLAVARSHAEDQYDASEKLAYFTQMLWMRHLELPIDEAPYYAVGFAQMKKIFLEGSYIQVFDLVEFLLLAAPRSFGIEDLSDLWNQAFEKYKVGYRIIDGLVVQIDTDVEVQAVETALEDAQPYEGARYHLAQALKLLADRENPDYPNSVKESLSAVESLGEAITGRDTLGKAVKEFEKNGVKVHPAQIRAWDNMYGWASNEGGIRHSTQTIPDVTPELAKYTLITTSAFVSWLIDAARKAGKL